MRATGKSDAEILDYMTSKDYNGATEEINRQRGETVFNNIIGVIGEQERK